MNRSPEPLWARLTGTDPDRWVECPLCDEEHPVYTLDGVEAIPCWHSTQQAIRKALYGE